MEKFGVAANPMLAADDLASLEIVALRVGVAALGAVPVDQIKSIDATARHMSPAGRTIDRALMEEILARLATLTA